MKRCVGKLRSGQNPTIRQNDMDRDHPLVGLLRLNLRQDTGEKRHIHGCSGVLNTQSKRQTEFLQTNDRTDR